MRPTERTLPDVTPTRRLVLVKHALPALDDSRPACEWQLGAEGEEQARRLAVTLRRFVPFRLFSSTEPKAARTAEIVAAELGIEMASFDGLHEIDRPVLPIMPREEHERFNARLFTAFDEPVIGTESARAALGRFAPAVQDLVEQEPAQNVVVVTHGTVIALFVAAHNQVDAFQLWQRLPCSACVVLGLPALELLETVDPVP
jgi:2,3-bisphosphoglycerate-dependent phosphoglycerate mutase